MSGIKTIQYIEIDNKIHQILKLVNRVIELKNVLAQDILTDEEKKPLYNRAWLLIQEINEVSKIKKENESN